MDRVGLRSYSHGDRGAVARDSAYADRMLDLARRFDSPDVRALAAEPLLLLEPIGWRTVHGDFTSTAKDALALLDAALAVRPTHPGATRLRTTLLRGRTRRADVLAGEIR